MRCGAMPERLSKFSNPNIAPRDGSSGVVLSFHTTASPLAGSRMTRSVKVPPISIPSDSGAPEGETCNGGDIRGLRDGSVETDVRMPCDRFPAGAIATDLLGEGRTAHD